MSGTGEPTRAQMRELEMLAARMSRDSRWQVTEAAFRLGFRLGAEPPAITAHVCGGKQAKICRVTGKEHDMSGVVRFKDGGSVACKDCGVSAMTLDLMELP